jgi:hypothetical protein
MEASLCYIAARMPLDRVVQGLGLVLGAPSDHRIADGDWIAHLHDTGFTLLWCEDEGYAFRQQAQLARLSMQGTVYSVQISEAMMAAEAVCYEGGTEAWHVLHQGVEGDLEASTTCVGGPVPEFGIEMAVQRARQKATPKGNAFFDVPVNIVAARIGFRYDQDGAPAGRDCLWHVVPPPDTPPSAKGWMSRLFGRR